MSKLLEFPDFQKSHDEACGWVARMDAGLSASDRAALEDWLAKSPQHAEALFEECKLWDDMDVMAELSELFPVTRNATFHKRFRRRLAVGVCAVVAGLSLWLSGIWHAPLIETNGPQAQTEVYRPPVPSYLSTELEDGTWIHETTIGGRGSARLMDGTSIMLNTNTRVAVRYSPVRRLVILERGEATFNVTPDSARPFDVRAGDRLVQAVGTIFNLHLNPETGLEVSVTEGRVRVARIDRARPALPTDLAGDRAIGQVLLAGELLVTNEVRSAVTKLAPGDIDAKLAWQRGMLFFRGEPLDTALREVERYTTAEFELADPELADIKVGGYFRAGELDQLLAALEENFGIRATKTDSKIVLSSD